MVHVRVQADELTVFHDARDQFFAAGMVGVFCILFGFATYGVLRQPLDATIVFAATVLGLATCVFGVYAVFAFIRGWRRVRHPNWLLRFTPRDVQVNLLHPGYARPGRRTREVALFIPLTEIGWLRKTTQPGAWDDERDEFHIDMAVSDRAFQMACAQRVDVRKETEGTRAEDGETVVRLIEGNVIRVLIGGGHWPQEITDFWDNTSYRVAPPLTINEPGDLASAKARPRELF